MVASVGSLEQTPSEPTSPHSAGTSGLSQARSAALADGLYEFPHERYTKDLLNSCILPLHTHIYVGVLVKYVNFGKGWRHRLFVLKAGVLRYYKVFGPSAVNAYSLLEKLRQQGEVVKIGSEVEVAETKWKRLTQADPAAAPPAAGDIHLQVAKLRASDSDDRKFYLDTGTVEIRLKADTRDDRWAWMRALNAAKSTWDGLSPAQASALNLFLGNEVKVKTDDNEFLKHLADVRAGLRAKGAPQNVLAAVEDELVQQHQRYHEKSAQVAARLSTLLEYVHELENEKRQLQTALVVEQRVKAAAIKASRGGDSSFTEKQSVRSEPDSDTVSDDAEGASGPPGAASDDEELFVDCEPAPSGALEAMELSPAQPSTSSGQEPAWISSEGPPPKRRTRMPKPKQVEKQHSLWSIIKECIGKDLSRVCLPVYFNEPLSALQKSAEDLEYCELLDQAAEYPAGSWERLARVACFAVSGYAATAKRTSKPFNPLLGETYEFVCAEKGFRFISEKVVHHPTIMAAYCEGREWRVTGDGELRSKFLGPSIQLRPVGIMHLTFSDNDEFTWHKVTTSINNIIIGKLSIDHGGVMHVRNPAHGLAVKMKFKQPGLLQFRGESHVVEGAFERNHKPVDLPKVDGKWDEALTITKPDGSQELLWKTSAPATDPTRHNWGTWVMALNEMTPGLEEKLAPTDCRLRPDQHYMEIGEFDKANSEKLRLEQKQRAARKAAEEGAPLEPRWFSRVPGAQSGESLTFRYKGGYFEARAQGHFEGCRDIFSDNPVTVNGRMVEVPPVTLNKPAA